MTIHEFQSEHRFLSNFYNAPFYYNGDYIKTVEHFYQSAKARNIDDVLRILNAPTPYSAKTLGSKVPLEDNWEDIKQQIMKVGVLNKFSQNLDMTMKLIYTGDEYLIEGNHWHDNYWGQCSCSSCQGHGKNILGEILMDTRDIVRGAIYGV